MVTFLRILAIILLFLNGLSALVGGIGLIGDPSGESLGWSTEMLGPSPFENFLIPGIILFVGNGLVSIAVAMITIKRLSHYAVFILFQGAILCGWIAIQMGMLQFYHPLHLICGVVGMLLILCGYLLSQNRW
ncbi:MAG: hypothetical protein ACXWV8_13880, partial [Chitinophagaceae bacterium]